MCKNFGSRKLTEISKSLHKIIKTFSKVIMILKIYVVWLKSWGCGSHLYFELNMAATHSILKLKIDFNNIFPQKWFQQGSIFFIFYSSLSGFWVISKNAILQSQSLPHGGQNLKNRLAEIIFLVKNIDNFFSSSKIELVAAILSSKYKLPPQPQFLSHIPQIFKIIITVLDVLMILLWLFYIC